MRRKSRLVLLVASLTAATALQAQHNPAGWIQGSGWNMLFLDQDSGCGGGGDVRMQGNWVTPYDMTVENPRPGDDWQIDFDAFWPRSNGSAGAGCGSDVSSRGQHTRGRSGNR